MNRTTPLLCGLVLCGGRSSRMGRDKCLMEMDRPADSDPCCGNDKGALSWAERQADVLRKVTGKVYLSLHSSQASAYRSLFTVFDGVIYDAAAETLRIPQAHEEDGRRGPAAAIISAHFEYPQHNWLVLAGDMIRITSEVLNILAEAYRKNSRHHFIAFETEAGMEPLAALYTAAGLSEILTLIRADPSAYSSPSQWLKTKNSLILKAPPQACFANMNSPADLV